MFVYLAIHIVDLCGSLFFAHLWSLYTIVDLVDNLEVTQEQKQKAWVFKCNLNETLTRNLIVTWPLPV